jgi:ferrochelatase
VERHSAGWPELTQIAADDAALAARHGRAVALGAAA